MGEKGQMKSDPGTTIASNLRDDDRCKGLHDQQKWQENLHFYSDQKNEWVKKIILKGQNFSKLHQQTLIKISFFAETNFL